MKVPDTCMTPPTPTPHHARMIGQALGFYMYKIMNLVKVFKHDENKMSNLIILDD